MSPAFRFHPFAGRRFRVALLFSVLTLCTSPAWSQVWAPEVVDRYLDYAKLHRLTEQPMETTDDSEYTDLCRPIYSPDGRLLHPWDIVIDPHHPGFIHLYANPAAVEARRKAPERKNFPIGAVLVKEKFEEVYFGKPSFITVMEKIANRGKVTDWRFLMIRLPDRTVVQNPSPASCVGCHSGFSKTGFVSDETDSLLTAFVKKTP